ncbi:MAG: carbamoyltransferase [Vulcanimicrobiota bacterium]
MNILGISAFYHDSAACLVESGRIVAAAQEERFTRKKADADFPYESVRYCLSQMQGELAAVAFYDKPLTKFHRILETYLSVAPRGLKPYLQAVPLWLREKLWIHPQIQQALEQCGVKAPEQFYFPEHHESHAASAFYPSPFQEAAIVTLDGVGEWTTTSIAVGEGNQVRMVRELHFPHSLGMLYSAFTYYTGFKVNSGEYKLMGLAPYGQPTYVDKIKDHLIDIKADGSYRLNMDYFAYLDDLVMVNERFHQLFGGEPRQAESPLTRREMDLAASIQVVTEEVVLKIAAHARELTGKANLCLAGGVALNCVANGRLLREGIFDDLWIQPAAGDAGGALGAAMLVWHQIEGKPRQAGPTDQMQGAYLGPEYSPEEIRAFLDEHGYVYEELAPQEWASRLAEILDGENVIGLLQGRMEFGPRALGNRSIIGDARSPKMQAAMNLKIKYRESFRPFAPSCLEECIGEYFELDRPSPYMLLVAQVQPERCVPPQGDERELEVREWVNRPRSDIPAITHVDFSARVQSVNQTTNPSYYALLKAFQARTGFGIITNTSFNVRGEPIVCTPEDAYRCFMRTEMDYLVLGPFLLAKPAQPEWKETKKWQEDFVLD